MSPSSELIAADYEYALPDHWIQHAINSDSMFSKLHRYYVSRAIAIIRASGAKSVLEAGCGDGWNVGQMTGMKAVGVDWSTKAIAYAKLLAPDAEFYCGDLRDAEFEKRFPNPFDAVALIEVLEHIPPADAIEAVRNIAKPLKMGGTFVLTTPHVNFPNKNPQHYRHFTPELLQEILQNAGLEVTAMEGYGDVLADLAYWKKMRWFDNRYYQIKPLADTIARKYVYPGPTGFDRCHGIIVTAKKIL
jgi:SAM-dependent methyltransferase